MMIREPSIPELSAPGRLDAIPERWAAVRGEALALADARGEWTWRELEAGRRQLAELLLTLGVRAGDRVMVVGENCATLVALLFAISSLDAWIVIVNARLAPREIDAIRAHARPRRVLYLGADSPDAGQHAERDRATPISLGRWAAIGVSALDDGCAPEPVAGDLKRDVAALAYGAKPGAPRAVMLTQANLLYVARVCAELRALTPQDRVYGVLPLAQVHGLASVGLAALRAGASLHLQSRFSAVAMAQCLQTQRITCCQGVPALFAKLVEHLRAHGKRFAAPALRVIEARGAPIAAPLKREVEALFGTTLHTGYGLTEAGSLLTLTRLDAPRRDASVGTPLPGVELELVDAAGAPVAPGEAGEVRARGPNIMKGYYRDPRATAAVLRDGGWLATDDIARREPGGAYFIAAAAPAAR